MQRDGCDLSNMTMSDFLCDFCHRVWTDDIPMIEGHQGSCICGNCLGMAWSELVNHKNNTHVDDWTCALCLESDEDRDVEGRSDMTGWTSPMHEDATACRRCVKRAAGVLHKDDDWNWTKPEA